MRAVVFLCAVLVLEIIALFGSGLGPATGAGARFNSSGLLETSLEGTRVLFNGVAAPLLYAQANQVNAILPYAVAAKSVTEVQVEYSGTRSMSVFLQVGPAAPGIFTWDSSGAGRGVVLHPDWSLNSASNPAPRGSVVVMYATGEGQTDPPGVDGQRAGDAPPKPRLPVAVSIGGQPASVLYAGGAPGFVAGLMQVNARIPDTAPASDAVPVVLTVGTAASQPGVMLAVR